MARAMNCGAVEDVLVEFLDGGLEPGPAAAVREHLAGCAGCAALREDLRAALALVHTDLVPEPPIGTWERFGAEVREKIRRAEEASPVGRPSDAAAPQPPPRSGLPRPGFGERLSARLGWARFAPQYAAAAAALLLLVGIVLNQPGPFPSPREVAMVQDLEVLRGVDRPDELEMIEGLPALLALVRES